MLEGIEAPIDRRGRPLDLALLLDKMRHITPRDGARVLGYECEKQAQIAAIIVDSMGRIVPPAEVGTEVGNGDGFHRLLSSERVALRNPSHGVLILVPFRRIIELRIAQRLVE